MPEILPSGPGVDEAITRLILPGQGRTETLVYTGPRASIEAIETETVERQRVGAITNVASIQTVLDNRGRGTLTITRELLASDSTSERDGTQELFGIEIVRDISTAPYFASLSNAQIIAVRDLFEQREAADGGWSTLQKRLYGHLAHGQESYTETAYEFRQSWTTSSTTAITRAATGVNTVQALPPLSGTLRRLVSQLPAGEWLKKPTTVTSAGRRGWTVSLHYQWAPQWSVIYGGSFTGD